MLHKLVLLTTLILHQLQIGRKRFSFIERWSKPAVRLDCTFGRKVKHRPPVFSCWQVGMGVQYKMREKV